MRIEHVLIHNFRGVIHQEFTLNPYTLLIGGNNAGKSIHVLSPFVVLNVLGNDELLRFSQIVNRFAKIRNVQYSFGIGDH